MDLSQAYIGNCTVTKETEVCFLKSQQVSLCTVVVATAKVSPPPITFDHTQGPYHHQSVCAS